ncbi:MAG: 3-deoxy-D-manno-octulosonic acid transferase [Proteobacteria bacterium]|nr:3-deoxy-D-manno-octulosonic acid transferase [Pseudomonadota bacterium]
MASPLGLAAYRLATTALAPAVPFFLRQRALRGKEDTARLRERLGYASINRPEGRLIWIHGASVGESVAALPLVDAFLKSGNNVLVTSGTVTSATLMAERLPGGAIHQYAPVDTPAAAKRFLAHWRPDAGLFVESELWPNLLYRAGGQGVKLALVNGRMSERSFHGWRRAPRAASALLSQFDICLAQDTQTANRLSFLGARHVEVTGSLKADAPPLPADQIKLAALKQAIGQRPVFLAASTHPGEDETLLPAQDKLRGDFPNLLTIIAPRHPERGADIAMLCGSRAVVRRSEGALPTPQTQVYVADTIGELGLLYRLSPFAFIGGSLIPHGGQNPLEPARLGCAVLTGPHTENFTQAYGAILSAQGSGRVSSAAEIASMSKRLIEYPNDAKTMGEAAARAAAALGGAVGKTIALVEVLLHAVP